MQVEIWLAFVAAAVVLLVIPGPTILTVISYSMTHGRKANLPIIAGVALGDSTALCVSLVGLGALLASSAFWFTVVKFAGGFYLLWLGLKLLRGAKNSQNVPSALPPKSWQALFANTYTVTALNPKGIVFFVAFLPQFVSPEPDGTLQLWILAATFVFLATLNAALYAVFASSARKLLMTQTAQRRFNVFGGVLLTGAGVWALLARRPQ